MTNTAAAASSSSSSAEKEPLLEIIVENPRANANPVPDLMLTVQGKFDTPPSSAGRDLFLHLKGEKSYEFLVNIEACSSICSGKTRTSLSVTLVKESLVEGGYANPRFHLVFALCKSHIISERLSKGFGSDGVEGQEMAGLKVTLEGEGVVGNVDVFAKGDYVYFLLKEEGSYNFTVKLEPPPSSKPISPLEMMLINASSLTSAITHGYCQSGNLVGVVIKGIIELGFHHAKIHAAIMGLEHLLSLGRKITESDASAEVVTHSIGSGVILELVQNVGESGIEIVVGEPSLTSNADDEGRMSGSEEGGLTGNVILELVQNENVGGDEVITGENASGGDEVVGENASGGDEVVGENASGGDEVVVDENASGGDEVVVDENASGGDEVVVDENASGGDEVVVGENASGGDEVVGENASGGDEVVVDENASGSGVVVDEKFVCPFHLLEFDGIDSVERHCKASHKSEFVSLCPECKSLFLLIDESNEHEVKTNHVTVPLFKQTYP